MKLLNRTISLFIFILIVLVGCAPKIETVTQTSQVHILSGDKYSSVDYPDQLLDITRADGPVYGQLDILEATMGLYSDYDVEEQIISIVRLDQHMVIDLVEKTIKNGDKEYTLEDQVHVIDEDVWLALDYFEDLFQIEVRKNEDETQFVIKDKTIDYKQSEIASKSDLLMIDNGEWKPISQVEKKTAVIVLSQTDEYVEVYTDDFQHGYVIENALAEIESITVDYLPYKTSYQQEQKNVFLAWDQNYQKNPTEEVYGSIDHVNVLSPTWLTYKNSKGDLSNRISSAYIEWAQNENIDVWVLVTNDFDPDRTRDLIYNYSTRKRAIDNLINALEKHPIKGLNIDFENIYKEDKNKLVQFVAELTAECHKRNIDVSMDVTMMGGSDNWSKCYDREKLGNIADYLVIMAYDQHWASSPVSGTVAGINWVEDGLNAFLEIVPRDKIILGLPLYTRVWRETPSTQVVNAMSVKSKAITMAASQRIIDEKELTPIWDEASGQYYVAYIEDETLYKIWHEDFKSLKLKAALVEKYNLGGAAVWRRGYEAVGTWDVIENAMKE